MNKTQLFLTTFLTAWTLTASAQVQKTDEVKVKLEDKDTVAWVKSGQLNLGAVQGFLHNWASGGELASIQTNGLFAGNATHYNHNKIWSNDLLLAYGLNYVYSNSFIPRKVDDRIDFTSKYGVRSNRWNNWYLTGLLNLRTQFTKGYDYAAPEWRQNPVSDFLSPAYLTAAVGVEYRKDKFSLFFSPLAARFTFADEYYTSRSAAGAFGIDSGKTVRVELGAYLSARWEKELTPAITYRTRFDLYSNYLAKDKVLGDGSVRKDNPGNVDVLFDNFLGLKVNKYLGVAIGLTLIYDNDFPYSRTYIDPNTNMVMEKNEPGNRLGWIQINQVLNIGLTYKF